MLIVWTVLVSDHNNTKRCNGGVKGKQGNSLKFTYTNEAEKELNSFSNNALCVQQNKVDSSMMNQ